MNTAVNLQLVHESEAQRQYARIRIPSSLQLDGITELLPLHDMSAGGFSVVGVSPDLMPGKLSRGRLRFNVDGFELALDVAFSVRSRDDQNGRTGFEFQDLDNREVAALRYLITSYLAGEVVTVGDMLNTLARENFTNARKKGGVAELSLLGRGRALITSTLVLGAGVAAFGWVGLQLWSIHAYTQADAAMLSLSSTAITMPRDGVFTSLVTVGDSVKAGQTLASFQVPVLAYLNGALPELGITPDKLQSLFGQQVNGSLISPCDCVVLKQSLVSEQYAARGSEIFQLVPVGTKPEITARFGFDQGARLRAGQAVEVELADGRQIKGSVSSLHALTDAAGLPSSTVTANISTLESLPMSALGQPVQVRVARWNVPALDPVVSMLD